MYDRTAFSTPLRLLGAARSEKARSSARGADDPSAGRPVPPLLDEPSLFYDPPYATRLHDAFAWHLVKYLERGSGLRYRVNGPAFGTADLTVDFVVEHGPLRVGFMCGTSAAGVARDRLLDAARVRHAAIDVLYRFRANDVERHLHDALLLAARWDTALFSERGGINLNTLATPEARAVRPRPVDTVVTLRYEGAEASAPEASLRVQRLSRTHPAGWMRAYERACRHFGTADPPPGWARSA